MLKIDALPAFDDNYIWLIQDQQQRYAAIVDPGDAEVVIAHLREHAITPVAILITHHHGDHTGGIRELVAAYRIPVYGPAKERIPALTHPLSEGQVVELPQLEARFAVIDAPGHTKGHVLYYGHGALFCGDTLFSGGCGRVFEGTPEQMYASLSKINALPDETMVYCAHEYTLANLKFAAVVEPESEALRQRTAECRQLRANGLATVPSRLGVEKATNPFLRCKVENVVAAAEAYSGKILANPAKVFATVRYWKDQLD